MLTFEEVKEKYGNLWAAFQTATYFNNTASYLLYNEAKENIIAVFPLSDIDTVAEGDTEPFNDMLRKHQLLKLYKYTIPPYKEETIYTREE
jgi:hypothetical protein